MIRTACIFVAGFVTGMVCWNALREDQQKRIATTASAAVDAAVDVAKEVLCKEEPDVGGDPLDGVDVQVPINGQGNPLSV